MTRIEAFVCVVAVALGLAYAAQPSVNCPVPVSPLHGQAELTPAGAFVRYACNPGYKLIGTTFAICNGNKWEPDPPTCQPRQRSASLSNPKISCAINFGGCSQRCSQNREGQVSCLCRDGYRLHTDNRTCLDIDECQENNYSCSHKCTNIRGGAFCSCPRGYRMGSDSKSCVDINECSYRNFGCSHNCVNTEGSAHCSCPIGYKLDQNGKRCIDIDECKQGICNYPYECINTLGSAFCSCPSGYQMDAYSESCVDIDECRYWKFGCSHYCVNTEGSAHCSCPVGYELHQNGKRCIDINECQHNNYDCSYECVNTPGSAFCSCPPGYQTDADSKSCVDINECSYRNFGCSHDCVNTEGSAHCSCPVGYELHQNGKQCIDINECAKNNGYCSQKCINFPGSYHCSCDDGYILHSDQKSCSDIDECQQSNYHCSHECVNTPGSAFCSCPSGYQTDTDSKSCVDIDECAVKNGGCEGVCQNFDGGYNCSCSNGYQKADFHSCSDFDECAENNGNCDQKCINFPGSFYCSCHDGFRLNSDQKSCSAVTCPRVLHPSNGKLECYDKDNQRLNETDTYSVNTWCQTKCNKGYRKNFTASLTCQENGKWDGNLAECRALTCPKLTIPENGDVYPETCKNDPVEVLKVCYISCKPGYDLIGPSRYFCSRNQGWKSRGTAYCKRAKITPYLKCPDDITVDLTGENGTEVYIPRPESNMNITGLQWYPKWVRINNVTTFPPGVTKISFQLKKPKTSFTCNITVHVKDNEAPKVVFCPESSEVRAEGSYGANVMWEEPIFTDNVNVTLIYRNMEPNSTLHPGSYYVKYSALDNAGNAAVCEFVVNVTIPICENPVAPAHGYSNCSDWILGTICEPTCDIGYILYPREPNIFVCDSYGTWHPSNIIQNCTPFKYAINSTCPDDFEYQVDHFNLEEICVACPQQFLWSNQTRMCTEKNVTDSSL